jgi:ribA/ribD-fused uncharacterized protein
MLRYELPAATEQRVKNAAHTLEAAVTEIHFFLPSERPYGALSNYYRRPLLINGFRYLSVEHAYQAGKARRAVVREWVAQAPTAIVAAVVGDGLPQDEILPGWEAQRVALMREILRAKFTQNDDLQALLLATGDALLVEWATEDSPVNRFWSKVNGQGTNMLGQLLMDLRSELQSQSNTSADARGHQSGRPANVKHCG